MICLYTLDAVLDVPRIVSKHLTTWRRDACRVCPPGLAAQAAVWAFLAVSAPSWIQIAAAQDSRSSPAGLKAGAGASRVQTATIHWQDVPLRDAIQRLQRLFNETVFLDRRIDPTTRVTLAAESSSVEDVMRRLAAEHGWGVVSLGDVVYVGPKSGAAQLTMTLPIVAEAVKVLPRADRARFARRRKLDWEQLTEPRALVTELVKKNGWQIQNADQIPHDLWPAGKLDGLTLAEQLALLLLGFERTYEFRAEERAIEIIALKPLSDGAVSATLARTAPNATTESSPEKTRQVYSLRVEEKPVGAVTRELARRLNWQVEFDEKAIEAAGLSLEARVTFKVDDVDQEELLDALLGPVGLSYRREGERIVIVPAK